MMAVVKIVVEIEVPIPVVIRPRRRRVIIGAIANRRWLRRKRLWRAQQVVNNSRADFGFL